MKCGTQCGRFFIVLAALALGSASLHAAMLPEAAGDIGISEFRTLVPIYRFWSPLTGIHFYTIDQTERDRLINEYPPTVWVYEGIAYHAYARPSEPGLTPIFRFWSPVTGGHFFTIDEAERDRLINESKAVWNFEGTAFYAYPEGKQPAGAQAVYRFWSPVTGGHFYTIDVAERDRLIKEFKSVWNAEGVAWYAYADPNAVEPALSGSQTFEFTGGDESASCTLTLKAYVNGVEAAIDHPQLTFGPQTGYMRMAVDFGAMTTMFEEVLIESESVQHVTTIHGGAQGNVVIPVTLSGSVIFWAVTPRGPYAVNPQSLAFPVGSKTSAGDNETFTLTGSVTLDGNKLSIGQVVRATRFAEGRGEFDDTALPEQLDVRMAEPFQWTRSQHEDRLIQTTVQGNQVQLYLTGAQVQTTGVWLGVPSE